MELIKYLRNEEGHPIGCVLALDKEKLSWSLCAKGDRFTKAEAYNTAWNKFDVSLVNSVPEVVSSPAVKCIENIGKSLMSYKGKHPNLNLVKIALELMKMQERANRYFK